MEMKGKAKMPAMYEGKSTKKGGGGRFAMVEDAARASGARDPGAVAAAMGRKKYGQAEMTKMATAGKKRMQKKSAKRR